MATLVVGFIGATEVRRKAAASATREQEQARLRADELALRRAEFILRNGQALESGDTRIRDLLVATLPDPLGKMVQSLQFGMAPSSPSATSTPTLRARERTPTAVGSGTPEGTSAVTPTVSMVQGTPTPVPFIQKFDSYDSSEDCAVDKVASKTLLRRKR